MKIKKYLTVVMITVMAFLMLGKTEVKAEQYIGNAIWPSEYINNIFIKKIRKDGSGKYQTAQFIRRSEDNKFVYCLQPFVDIDNNYIYNIARSDYAAILNLSEVQWRKISLLAYYGYGYGNHTEHKWYAVTQVLIWRTVEPSTDIYFTNTLNGSRNDSLYASEVAELEKLVSEHSKIPSFSLNSDTINIGSEITLKDNNGVLNNYSITASNNLSVSNVNGQLKIKATGIGNGTIVFKKIANLYDTNPVLYYATGTQNVMRVGNYDPITTSLNVKVIGGKVTIHKLDRDTGENIPNGAESSLEGAKYGIFDNVGNQITTVITKADGTIQSEYLPYIGKYTIKELESSLGYEIDKTEYSFEITTEDLFPNVTVYEQVIKRQIQIHKYYANGETGNLNPEENIIFEFYDKNNKMVAQVTTNKDGYATLNLHYGTYTGKQITTTPGHEKVEDFTITINEKSPEVINLSFSNAPIQARLKVVKIDDETGNVIKRSNIRFKIYDVIREEYVCQTISYPTAEKLCEFKTDENGILYTPYELTASTYKLEEVDQVIDGYLWNKESKEFVIDEDSEFIDDEVLGVIFEVKFPNKQVKGKIKINKFGESFNIEDGNFKYEKISLADVEFDVIANEDITIGGKEYYKKGDVVSTIKTDESGVATLDNIPLGKCILVEKITDENHILLDESIEFELKYQDQYTEKVIKEFDINNQYKKGTLQFTKTDLVDGTAIPGVEIKIFTENDELVFTGITNEEGQVIIENLPINTRMYIIETRAADNYQLTDEKVFFEIKENGEIVKASLTNEKIVIDVPDTGINDNYLVEVFGGILIIFGIGVIVYEFKKNRK